MLRQRTLKTLVRAAGVGLHTGRKVAMTLRPAQPDTGVVFRRTDLPQPEFIRTFHTFSPTAIPDDRNRDRFSTGEMLSCRENDRPITSALL